ncbi:uncharacterized protein C8A04DRAFT_35705 [Dichotomopilus funicola]|uniref:Uncharacterized protein n=1 Tax=Dichotomopilus funicola TaxID=1934379 RepID=A0AAN6V750_9PEZI|nr:hypothetical protein C8A04DRAFT_35705 [Dichotomopilus funicola]
MEQPGPIPRTPTRIPRPSFAASSPRAPSIRAVPYSHLDRVGATSKMAGNYSPSNWPFKNPTENRSMELPTSTTQRCNQGPFESNNNEKVERKNSKKVHFREMAENASEANPTEDVSRNGLSVAHTRGVSFDSVQTQIYAPTQNGNRASSEQSRPASTRGTFLQSTPEIPARPITPTPYSVLRKVSEVSEPDNSVLEDSSGFSRSGNKRPLSSTSESQQFQRRTSQESAGHSAQNAGTPRSSLGDGGIHIVQDSIKSHSIPTQQDIEGRILSRLHPLHPRSRASVRSTEIHQQAPQPLAGPSSSIQAEHGGSDDGKSTENVPGGIVILRPAGAEDAEDVPVAPGNTSLHSQRPTTLQSEAPDIESLRLGPRLRHNRLPPSPSTAINAGRCVPSDTRRLWTTLGRSRKVIFVSAIFLELSILNEVASVTAVTANQIEHGHAAVGLVVWAIVSAVLVLTCAMLTTFLLIRHRKLNKDLVSGESWIEMQLRSRPLPPRPQTDQAEQTVEQHKQDSGVTEAWQKFTQDHEQLRRYVEFLESRIGVLEEGGPNQRQQQQGEGVSGIGVSIGLSRHATAPSFVHLTSAGFTTPKFNTTGGSLSRHLLLQPDDSVADRESWRGSGSDGDDTKTSILTDLCEAITVTEGYSPLSAQTPYSTNFTSWRTGVCIDKDDGSEGW